MKKLIVFLSAVLLSAQVSAAQQLDAIAAIVNKNVITSSEVNHQVSLIKQQVRRSHSKMPPVNILRQQILKRMIDVDLQYQLAKESNVLVDDVELDNGIDRIAKQNKLSVSQLKHKLSEQGLPWADYKKNVQKEMTIAKLQQQALASKILITDKQVDNFLKTIKNQRQANNAYHVKNISIILPETPSSDQLTAAEAKANAIISKLKAGADFSQVAMSESRGEKALKGGDLGWRKLAELPDVFAKQIVKMKVGGISQPIRTANGFHVIKLTGRKGGDSQKHIVTLTHVRHILIKTDNSMSSREAKQKLRHLRSRIIQGAAFAKVAKENSQDFASALKGGDIGWVKPHELMANFEITMNKLKPGKISRPIQTQYGWHLIEVLGRKKKDETKSFQREQVRRMLFSRKFGEAIENWVQQLRSQAYVKVMDKA